MSSKMKNKWKKLSSLEKNLLITQYILNLEEDLDYKIKNKKIFLRSDFYNLSNPFIMDIINFNVKRGRIDERDFLKNELNQIPILFTPVTDLCDAWTVLFYVKDIYDTNSTNPEEICLNSFKAMGIEV
jgi:hypothetical protein